MICDFERETISPEMTEELAQELARKLEPGDVIGLDGDLGAGKTVFVKGLARGLGIAANIKSPTFNLVRSYEGRLPLFHFDIYRIDDTAELLEIGFSEYFEKGGAVVVEWAEKAEELMPDNTFWISIRRTGDDTRRIVGRRER